MAILTKLELRAIAKRKRKQKKEREAREKEEGKSSVLSLREFLDKKLGTTKGTAGQFGNQRGFKKN